MQTQEQICCLPFDPSLWDEKTIEWQQERFIKIDLPQIFHIPIPGTIGNMMKRSEALIQSAGANTDPKEYLWLCHNASPWKSENFIHVTKEVPGTTNVMLSGTFMAKVFEGPFQSIPQWIKEMEQFVSSKGKRIQKLFFYYTTCPKCAKKYGKNYVVLIAQV